jgi:uncharacterized protein YwqG
MANILRGLFGKKRQAKALRNVAAMVAPLRLPAIQVVVTDSPSLSHFGGEPNLPPDLGWPEKGGIKLGFLARLSLGEIQQAHTVPWLPQSGALLFFYDLQKQPWGFDPKDRGGFAVVLAPDLPALASSANRSPDANVSPIAFRNVSFRRIDVVPSDSGSVRAMELTELEWETLEAIEQADFGGKPKHQVSGNPSPVQGNYMDLECQLASNGVYCGAPEGYKSARALELESGKENWRLLFQVDSDDDLGVMWGDAGMLYYWIEEQEALKGNFTNAWLILQCC